MKSYFNNFRDKYSVIKSPKNISELIKLGSEFDNDELVIPEYQRELVWSLENKQSFIKSIFNQNHLGNMMLREEKKKDKNGKTIGLRYHLIDGQQRLDTLKEYISNVFAVSIDGDEVYFKALSQDDVNSFMHTVIDVDIIMGEISFNDELDLYLAKNFAGVTHTQDELEDLLLRYKKDNLDSDADNDPSTYEKLTISKISVRDERNTSHRLFLKEGNVKIPCIYYRYLVSDYGCTLDLGFSYDRDGKMPADLSDIGFEDKDLDFYWDSDSSVFSIFDLTQTVGPRDDETYLKEESEYLDNPEYQNN